MFIPLISQKTQNSKLANVCFVLSVGLEKKSSLRNLFVDVITISLFCFLIGKMDFFFKKRIHLGKL